MKKKQFAFTLDLEAAVSGVLEREYTLFESPETIRQLLDLLREEDVKATIFVVGEIFERYPEIVRLFQEYDCEFHGHSYSHDPACPDSEEEVKKVKELFVEYFGYEPQGYRAPQGKISEAGIEALTKHGYKFDSSVVPSYYPNPFKYLFKNRQIHRHKGFDLVEIPLTSISPFRLTLSISYVKLLGYGVYKALWKLFRLPPVIVFCSHLHDFFLSDDEMTKLPPFWKMIYSRNRGRGLELLRRVIVEFKARGYEFVPMSEIYGDFIEDSKGNR
jgi:peptidoglycan/xylan/chitin deacetylase (PgdA/CDA1 family)